MATPEQALSALAADLELRADNVPVVEGKQDEPGPVSGPAIYVSHSRDLFSPTQWDNVITSEFTVTHMDSPASVARILAMYMRTRSIRVGSEDYTLVLRTTLDAPQAVRAGYLVDRTVQTVAVSYILTEPERVFAGVGGSLIIGVDPLDAVELHLDIDVDEIPIRPIDPVDSEFSEEFTLEFVA